MNYVENKEFDDKTHSVEREPAVTIASGIYAKLG